MRCTLLSSRTLLMAVLVCVARGVHGQAADRGQSPSPSAPQNPEGKPLDLPGPVLTGDMLHFYFASEHASSPNAADGIATLLASPACTASGCTVIADPLDPVSDRFPYAMPDKTQFLDYRNGQTGSWSQNPEGPANLHWYSMTKVLGDKGYPKTYNITHGIFQFNALANNATGWAYGLGGNSTTWGEYISDMFRQTFQIHAAGITNVFANSGTISKPDDVNYDNNYIAINPAAYGLASEGVTFHRDYLNYAPPYFGVILTGGVGSRTMTLRCIKSCVDMSLYTPLIDTTKDVLSGSVQFQSSTPLGTGFVETLSTDFNVPASLYGDGYYIPAQTNVQGLVFSATKPGSGAAVATVAFDGSTRAADAKAVSVHGDAISVAIKRADGTTRTLGDVLAVFSGGRVSTPVAGAIAVFVAKGVDPDLTAKKSEAKALAEVAAPRQPDGVPIETTFVVGTATPLVAGQMIDMMGPEFNEVTTPVAVGKVVDGLQLITAPLYFSHAPTSFCANTSTAPGSGMVGRYIELTNYTKLTFAGVQRYVQTILCSPTNKTLLMGTIGYGSFQIFGKDSSPQPATIFHGADLREIFNPEEWNKTQQVNGPGYGTYAAVDANDTFDVGDTVENTPYAVQNWNKNRVFMDVEDPFATWHGYAETYTGPGLNGAWTALVNKNPRSLYADRGGNLYAPDFMRLSGVWGGGITWDELPARGGRQSSREPYLLYVENWTSTTQQTLGVFRAGAGSILFNHGKDGASSFFEFGVSGNRNGIKAGRSSFDAVTAESVDAASTVTAGQFVGEGAAPSVGAGVAAGSGSSVKVTGTNVAGVITLTTGRGATAAGTVTAVRFHGKLAVAPQGCSLMAREPNAASAATTIFTSAPDATTWTVNVGKSALTDGTTYVWSYICM